jgi:hypothetical protein
MMFRQSSVHCLLNTYVARDTIDLDADVSFSLVPVAFNDTDGELWFIASIFQGFLGNNSSLGSLSDLMLKYKTQ